METKDSTHPSEPQTRECVICGASFTSYRRYQATCGKKDCKEKHMRAYHAHYREKNRAKIRAVGRDWYAKHKDQERERRNKPAARAAQYKRHKAWKAAHRERVRELALAYYYRHKDNRNAKSKEWYARRKAEAEAAQQLVLDLTAKLEQAKLRAAKFTGGKNRKDEEAAMIDQLINQGIGWDAVTEQMNRRTGEHRTANAYLNLRKRWLARPKK